MTRKDRTPVADEHGAAAGKCPTARELGGLSGAPERIELSPPSAAVTVVRPVRLPFDIDLAVKDLAAERGVPVSSLIRDWIAEGLAHATVPDPVTDHHSYAVIST